MLFLVASPYDSFERSYSQNRFWPFDLDFGWR